MMNIAIIVLLAALFVAAAVLGLRYYTHMLQLSSYQFQGYFRFLKSRIISCALLHFLVLAVFVYDGIKRGINAKAFFESSSDYVIAIGFLIIGLGALAEYFPKPAKKK